MTELPSSFRLKPELKRDLEEESRLANVSENDLVELALESFLNLQAHKRDVIAAAAAEADKGVFISGEAMHRWIESWGAENELPPPEPDIFPKSPRT